MPDFTYENQHGRLNGQLVAGVDEAGRGPLAGPVVAAAVIWPAASPPADLAAQLNDSKKLTAKKRAQLFSAIQQHSYWAIAEASVAEIDQINILQASLLAMQRAALALPHRPSIILVDGNQRLPQLPSLAIVRGDALSLSIAAASILAKVARDTLMQQMHEQFPHYGFDRHAGYPTAAHLAALQQHGATAIHRRSFAPVAALLAKSA